MDLNKFKSFFFVAVYGSVTKSSLYLNLSKSSISRNISILENEFNTKLFYRKSNKLELTPKGNYLYNKLSIVFDEINNIQSNLNSTNIISGKFKIATTHALISTWLCKFIHKFLNCYPNLEVEIFANNVDLALALQSSTVAIRPYCKDAEHLNQEFLMRWRLNLFASKNYLKKNGYLKKACDLDFHKILIFDDSVYPKNYTQWPLVMHTKSGKPRKPYLILNSLQAMYELVENGVGIGVFAEDSPLINKLKVVKVLPKIFYTDIDVYYIYPNSLKNNSAVNLFGKFLREQSLS